MRTRNRQPITFTAGATAWLGLTFFEPAHFIMERGMLLGVKRRTEQARGLQAGIASARGG